MAALSRTITDGILAAGRFLWTPRDFYVDFANGNDSNTGLTVDQPLKTIQAALDEAGGWDQINIRDNAAHQITTPLTITDGNISYAARLPLGQYEAFQSGYLTLRGYANERNDGGIGHIDGGNISTSIMDFSGIVTSYPLSPWTYCFIDLKFGNVTGNVLDNSDRKAISMVNCEVYGNGGASIIIGITYSSTTLNGLDGPYVGCYFHGNATSTISLFSDRRDARMVGCVFAWDTKTTSANLFRNYGGQVVTKCLFLHEGAGSCITGGGGDYFDCTFIGTNGAETGITADQGGNTFTVLNNIITGFTNGVKIPNGTDAGRGVYANAAPQKYLGNNLMWNNTNNYVNFLPATTALDDRHNDILADPQFTDPDNNDFTLGTNSPAYRKDLRYSLGGTGFTKMTEYPSIGCSSEALIPILENVTKQIIIGDT